VRGSTWKLLPWGTIATWSRVLPWQQVAVLFGCAWGTVERAVEAAVAHGLAHRDLGDVTHIGIDEISRKKGHVYVTNVSDLRRKRLVWSGEGRTQATRSLALFRKRRRCKCKAGVFGAVSLRGVDGIDWDPGPLVGDVKVGDTWTHSLA
jgi:hypothetical protein